MKRITYKDFSGLAVTDRIEQQIQNVLVNSRMATPAWRFEARRMESWERDAGYNGAWYEVEVVAKRKRKPSYCVRFWADAFRGTVYPESMEWVYGCENWNPSEIIWEMATEYPDILDEAA